MGDNAGIMTDALWAGTFHGIGARLLRDYADQIGLDSAFTIHDREDFGRPDEPCAARARVLEDGKPVSDQGHVPCHLFAMRQCRIADRGGAAAASFPWCAAWAAELKQLFAAYVEAKQRQNVLDYDDLLLYWAQMVSDPGLADEIGGRFDHVLVDEYQDTNRLQASILAGAEARRARPHRGRRRCAVDLFVSRRDGAQHPRLSRRSSARRLRSSRSTATIARRSRSLPPPTA